MICSQYILIFPNDILNSLVTSNHLMKHLGKCKISHENYYNNRKCSKRKSTLLSIEILATQCAYFSWSQIFVQLSVELVTNPSSTKAYIESNISLHPQSPLSSLSKSLFQVSEGHIFQGTFITCCIVARQWLRNNCSRIITGQ